MKLYLFTLQKQAMQNYNYVKCRQRAAPRIKKAEAERTLTKFCFQGVDTSEGFNF